MKAIVLGCGLMGSVVAWDLSRSGFDVTVLDSNAENLKRVDGLVNAKCVEGDVGKKDFLVDMLSGYDVVVGALPHAVDAIAVEAALKVGVSMVDLIFGWRYDESEIDSIAKNKNITIVTACGLAPGLSNILTMYAVDSLDRTDDIRIKTGGLPQKPSPPLNYRVTWALDDVMEEYTRPARIIKDGKMAEVEALTGREKVVFPPPVGECEAFFTDGLSSLVSTIKNVQYMDEKTIRYPGHVDEILTLIQCGLLDQTPIEFSRGVSIAPRKFVTRVLGPKLALRNDKDVTLLRIDAKGIKDGRKTTISYEMVDYFDDQYNVTSMARTTAFPASIAAQMLANGEVDQKGVVPPELAFRGKGTSRFMKELSTRGVKVTMRREEDITLTQARNVGNRSAD